MATHTTSPSVKSHSPSGLVQGFDRSNIEDALNTALHHVRNAHDTASIQVATGKTIRAATLLKRACEAAREGGVA
jgi:hypothetical protein